MPRRLRPARSVAHTARLAALCSLGVAGCSADDGKGSSSSTASSTATTTATTASPIRAERCIVRLHGKGGDGAGTQLVDGVAQLYPAGNGEGWGGREWRSFPDDAYAVGRDIVAASIDGAGCTSVMVDGFSNGGAFAAALFCAGETFDGRLVRVVIDDPVPDASADDCAPATGVAATLYWTGALADQSAPGTDCGAMDWTCEGGTTVGIDAFAASLGVEAQPSPFTDHTWYVDAPELSQWPAG